MRRSEGEEGDEAQCNSTLQLNVRQNVHCHSAKVYGAAEANVQTVNRTCFINIVVFFSKQRYSLLWHVLAFQRYELISNDKDSILNTRGLGSYYFHRIEQKRHTRLRLWL